MGTTYFCDPTTGDDGDNGSTWALAKKTFDAALNLCSAGDEVRIAKSSTTAIATGNLTFTNDSATVTGTGDFTGEIAVGDFIKLNSDNALPNSKMWWRVRAISYGAPTTTITLGTAGNMSYYGPGGTGAASKLAPHASAGETLGNKSGSAGSMIKVSGGWNPTTGLVDGETWIKQSGTTLTGNGLAITADYLDMRNCKIGVCDYSTGWIFNGALACLVSDLYSSGTNTYGVLFLTNACTGTGLDLCYIAGPGNYGLYCTVAAPDSVGTLYVYGTRSTVGCLRLTNVSLTRVDFADLRGGACAVNISTPYALVIGKLYARSAATSVYLIVVNGWLMIGEADTGGQSQTTGMSGTLLACNVDLTTGNEWFVAPNIVVDKVEGRGGTGHCLRMDPGDKSVPGTYLLPPFLVDKDDTPTAFTFYQCSTSLAGATVPTVEVFLFQPNGLTIADHAAVTVTDVATAWDGNETQHTVDLTGTVAYDGVVQFGLRVTDNTDGDALFYFDDPALA